MSTFTPLTGGGSADSYQPGDLFGYQTAEKIRQNFDVLGYIGDHLPLGGDEAIGSVTGAGVWEAVDATKEYTLNGDELDGLTLELVAFYKTENAAQSVQLRLRNLTDSSNAAVTSVSTATTLTTETVAVTLPSGAKRYRLERTGGAVYAVFGGGHLRERKVP